MNDQQQNEPLNVLAESIYRTHVSPTRYVEIPQEVHDQADEDLQAVHERRIAREAKAARAWDVFDAAIAALNGLTEPVTRIVLDLHAPIGAGQPHRQAECQGCDAEGFEWEYPGWPCSTVQAIAAHHGIELPASGDLWGPRP